MKPLTCRSAAAFLALSAALSMTSCGSSDEDAKAKQQQTDSENIQSVATGIHGLEVAGPSMAPLHLTEGLTEPMLQYFSAANPSINKDKVVEWYKEKYDNTDVEDYKFLGTAENAETGKLMSWCWATDLQDENTDDRFLSLQVFDNSVKAPSASTSEGDSAAGDAETGDAAAASSTDTSTTEDSSLTEGTTTEIYEMKVDSTTIQGAPQDICAS